jgi:hypothetical protein
MSVFKRRRFPAETAYATIKGFEIMRMIRRRHCILIEPGVTGEVRFLDKLFDLAA